eukprot:s2932_g3.t1
MGWSWALFLANEAVAFITAGRVERPLSEVRDRLPAPDVSADTVTGVYVDNISIIGPTVEAVEETRDRVLQEFGKLGIPLTWSTQEPSATLETIGVVFDFNIGVARNKPRRIWRAFMAGKELLRRRRVSVKILEIWLGHMTSLFMISPQALSCFFHIYKFVQQYRGRRAELWQSVREEIKMALGVVWMCRATLEFNPVFQVDAGDSSSSAFALMTTEASHAEIAEACRWRETWRFRPLAEEVKRAAESGSRAQVLEVLESLHTECTGPVREQELKPSAQFGAGLRSQFGLLEASNPDSWLRTSAISSQLRAKASRRVVVEVPAMIPPVDQRLVDQDRYHLLWRKKWRQREDGHITLKEGRVALSSLKRTCRSAGLHDKWKLTLTDNLSCLAAFERGRATSFALNQLCRTAAAYAMSCGVRWRLRHVETKRNPADKDSRFDTQRQHGAPMQRHKNFPFDRGKAPGLTADTVSEGNLLPGTSTSVRGSATAIFGRGGNRGDTISDGPRRKQSSVSLPAPCCRAEGCGTEPLQSLVVLRGSEIVEEGGKRCSVPKTRAAGAYPFVLVKRWAQVIETQLSRVSRDSELFDLQWQNELKSCLPKQLSEEQIRSSSAKLTRVEALGEAEDCVVFGQDTSQKAAQKQEKLRRRKNYSKFEKVTGCTDQKITPETSTAQGS